MDEKINLSNGGIVIVAYLTTGYVKEYANNAQIRFIDCKDKEGPDLENLIPVNLKGIILGPMLGHYYNTWFTALANRKRIPFLIRNSNQGIYDLIKTFFPNGNEVKPSLEEVKETQAKGRLNILIPHIDWNKSNSENAKILLEIAQEKGIKTTFGSLSQFVGNNRRKEGRSEIPRSIKAESIIVQEILDKSIADLTSIRDYIIKTEKENVELRAKFDKLKSIV